MRIDIPLTSIAVVVRVEKRPSSPSGRSWRFSVRRLIIAAAVPALLLGAYLRLLETERWAQYARLQAAEHGRWEERHREAARLALESGSRQEADRYERLAEGRRSLRRKWQLSLWHPWSNVAPDPPGMDTVVPPDLGLKKARLGVTDRASSTAPFGGSLP